MTRADVIEKLRGQCAAGAMMLRAPLELMVGDLGRRVVVGVRIAPARDGKAAKTKSQSGRLEIGLRKGAGVAWMPTAWMRREAWGEATRQVVNTAGLERILEVFSHQPSAFSHQPSAVNIQPTTAPAFERPALTVERAENLRQILKPVLRNRVKGSPVRDRVLAVLRERGPLPIDELAAAAGLKQTSGSIVCEMIARGHLRVVGWMRGKTGRKRVLGLGPRHLDGATCAPAGGNA